VIETAAYFLPECFGQDQALPAPFSVGAMESGAIDDSLTVAALYILKPAGSMLLKKSPHLGQQCTFFAVARPAEGVYSPLSALRQYSAFGSPRQILGSHQDCPCAGKGWVTSWVTW